MDSLRHRLNEDEAAIVATESTTDQEMLQVLKEIRTALTAFNGGSDNGSQSIAEAGSGGSAERGSGEPGAAAGTTANAETQKVLKELRAAVAALRNEAQGQSVAAVESGTGEEGGSGSGAGIGSGVGAGTQATNTETSSDQELVNTLTELRKVVAALAEQVASERTANQAVARTLTELRHALAVAEPREQPPQPPPSWNSPVQRAY